MVALAERLQESQQRVLPWWTPTSISVFDGRKWQTRKGATYYPAIFAVNPIDVRGYAHFAAFDIDSRDRTDVDKLLTAIPKGAVLLVSESGRKGWHCWSFPSEPIPPQVVYEFVRRIAEKAGVRCEVFPSSERTSRCLKWVGCCHPETGVIEEFINWPDGRILDTTLMVQAIEEGFYRTPLDVINEVVSDTPLTRQASRNPGGGTSTGTAGTENGTNIRRLGMGRMRSPSIIPLSGCSQLLPSLTEWLQKEEVALAMVRSLGARVRGIGRAFCCVLPGHAERRPSASLYRSERDGSIVYVDWHCRTTDGKGKPLQYLTLPEVYSAACTGIVQELPSAYQQAAWGWRLLVDLGFVVPPDVEALSLPDSIPALARRVYEGFVLLLQTKRLGGLDGPSYFSKQFAASWCAVEPVVACKAMNLLATIGALQKCGRGTNAFLPGQASTEEMAATYDALGKPSVSEFNKELVRRKLGDETAQTIFRR